MVLFTLYNYNIFGLNVRKRNPKPKNKVPNNQVNNYIPLKETNKEFQENYGGNLCYLTLTTCRRKTLLWYNSSIIFFSSDCNSTFFPVMHLYRFVHFLYYTALSSIDYISLYFLSPIIEVRINCSSLNQEILPPYTSNEQATIKI